MTMLGLRIAAVLVVCGGAFPIGAQQTKPPKPPPPPKAAAKPSGGKNGGAGPKSPAVKSAEELDQVAKMTPAEREKALAKLPPQRRAAFEQHLARYMMLTPEQRERVKLRVEQMESLPKDRQNAVRQEIMRLQALPFAQRRQLLNSEEMSKRFSPDEEELIRDSFPNIKRMKDED